jgi:hypothetical protein
VSKDRTFDPWTAGWVDRQPSRMALDLARPTVAPPRLDHDLMRGLRVAVADPWVLGFLGLQAVAGAVLVARRGPDLASTVVLIWLGLAFVGFIAWWAGRHRLAHPAADPVPRATGRLLASLAVAAGLAVGTAGVHQGVAALLTLGGVGAWLSLVLRRDAAPDLARMLRRSWRPFGPLLILSIGPRLLLMGPAALATLPWALISGIVQQLLFLPLLFVSLEATLRRRSAAAVIAALIFGAIHVPMNLEPNGGDLIAAVANAVVLQASVGLIACMAFVRHRAALPIGVAHALTIA